MEIIKVEKDKQYKHDYIKMDGSIHILKDALSLYPEHKDKILKTHYNKLTSAKVEHLKFTRIPSDMKIVELIEKKRDEIYSQLNLSATTSITKKANQAKLLLNYLAQNLTYYTPIKEEVKKQYNLAYEKAIYNQVKKFSKTQELHKSVKNELKHNPTNKGLIKKEQALKNIMNHHKIKMVQLYSGQVAEYKRADERHMLQSMYKALVEKKGVCYDFSLAYSYLLTGLEIENKCISLRYTEQGVDNYHMVNLLGLTKDNNQTKYSYVDVTDANLFLEISNTMENGKDVFEAYLTDQVNGANNLTEFNDVYPKNSVYNAVEFNHKKVYFTKLITDKKQLNNIMSNVLENKPKKEMEPTL